VLIDHGKVMLYGNLEEIRHRFSGHAVLVRSTGDLPTVPGVIHIEKHNSAIRLTLTPTTSPQEVLRVLVAQNVEIEQFEIALPTLDEIFIRVVQGEASAA
jgi:ABC-2 type transport system ATP-binding protein